MVVLDSVEILWRSFHEGEMLLSYNIIIREVIRKKWKCFMTFAIGPAAPPPPTPTMARFSIHFRPILFFCN